MLDEAFADADAGADAVAVAVTVVDAVAIAVAVAVICGAAVVAVSGGIGGAGGGVLSAPPHASARKGTAHTTARTLFMVRHVKAECGTRQPVIGRLTGRVVNEELDIVVLDVGGVGYEITVPLGTIGRALHDDAGRVTLFVHTHVREDALSLFGFASESDRITFRTLIGISNVGPKTAITVLSVLPSDDLARAVTQGDLGKLTAVPGVGKKTAERLVLELKDKLKAKPLGASAPNAANALPGARKPSGQGEMLQDALVRMGYRPNEAERAVAGLGERVEAQPIADSLREALALLSK